MIDRKKDNLKERKRHIRGRLIERKREIQLKKEDKLKKKQDDRQKKR